MQVQVIGVSSNLIAYSKNTLSKVPVAAKKSDKTTTPYPITSTATISADTVNRKIRPTVRNNTPPFILKTAFSYSQDSTNKGR